MVFESIVANLLNTYLGDFVDDVSADQLRVGIWRGDVELKNLAVKENAFDLLDLPFKVIHGHVGELKASIPWNDLYNAPVIIKLKDVLVLGVPSQAADFDPLREGKRLDSAKWKQVEAVETVKKRLTTTDSMDTDDLMSGDKNQKKMDVGFAAKLAAQVIKNVQIRLENVHVSFEDKLTTPRTPFQMGVTLSRLIFETLPDCPTRAKDQEVIIYKLISLEGFAVYWNCTNPTKSGSQPQFISKYLDDHVRSDLLREKIARPDHHIAPEVRMDYILNESTFKAKSIIDKEPERDEFKIPVADVELSLEEFAVTVSKLQMESFLTLMSALGKMREDSLNKKRLAIAIRRYRPETPIRKGRTAAWWHYARDVLVESHPDLVKVRKSKFQWRWAHVERHLFRLRRYKELYLRKLRLAPAGGKLTRDETCELEELEKVLDAYNIVHMRGQAEQFLETERKLQEQRRSEAEKLKPKKEVAKASGGWFGGWLGGWVSDETKTKAVKVMDTVKDELDAAEMNKLYDAIGYDEGGGIRLFDFPAHFTAYKVIFKINLFLINYTNETTPMPGSKDGGSDGTLPFTSQFSLKNVSMGVMIQPTAPGVEFNMIVEGMTALLGPVTGPTPSLLFNNELQVDVRQRGEDVFVNAIMSAIQCSIADVQHYSKYFARMAQDVDAHILSPTQLNVIVNQNIKTGSQKISVTMGQVTLHVSPHIVNVLTFLSSLVLEQLSSLGQVAEQIGLDSSGDHGSRPMSARTFAANQFKKRLSIDSPDTGTAGLLRPQDQMRSNIANLTISEEVDSYGHSRRATPAIFLPRFLSNYKRALLWYFDYPKSDSPVASPGAKYDKRGPASGHRSQSDGEIQAATEVTESMALSPTSDDGKGGLIMTPEEAVHQLLLLSMESVTLIFESGGADSQPLVKILSTFKGQMDGYTKLRLTSSCLINYYNEDHFRWEPMLEPVEGTSFPWKYDLYVKLSKPEPPKDPKHKKRRRKKKGDEKITVKIRSEDEMNVSITKSAISTLMALSDSFSNAVQSTKLLARENLIYIENHLGIDVNLNLLDDLLVLKRESNDSVVLAEDLDDVDGSGIRSIALPHSGRGKVTLKNTATEDKLVESDLNVKVVLTAGTMTTSREISLKKKDLRAYRLPIRTAPHLGGEWRWILEIKQLDAFRRQVKLRSAVGLINRFYNTPLEVYHRWPNMPPTLLATIQPQETFYVPLGVVYSSEADQLYVRPSKENYLVSEEGISWAGLYPAALVGGSQDPRRPSQDRTLREMVAICRSDQPSTRPFYIRMKSTLHHVHSVADEINPVKAAAGIHETCYCKIELMPTFRIRNCLPVNVTYQVEGAAPGDKPHELPIGKEHDLKHVRPGVTKITVRLHNYLEPNSSSWKSDITLPLEVGDKEQTLVQVFESPTIGRNLMTTYLAIQLATDSFEEGEGCVIASLFAPFWMINNTGQTLTYRLGSTSGNGNSSSCSSNSLDESYIQSHASNYHEPIMMCFNERDLFKKKKMSIAVADSDFSDAFPIDVVGNGGNVLAKDKRTKSNYYVSIRITLSQMALTKIVTINPFYSIANRCKRPLEVSEDNDDWTSIEELNVSPLWPKRVKEPVLWFRHPMCQVGSRPVSLSEPNSCLLVLDESTLLFVTVEVSEQAVAITLDEYFDGSAPAVLINATEDLQIEYSQYGDKKSKVLPPMNSAYFTWSEPNGRRELVWQTEQYGKNLANLDEDQLATVEDKSLHWVSFLDGKQRVLLWTRDPDQASHCLRAFELTQSNFDLEISLAGLGLSLVDDERRMELIYASIIKSDTVWEVRKENSKRFKTLAVREIAAIESAYQKELLSRRVSIDGGQSRQQQTPVQSPVSGEMSDLAALIPGPGSQASQSTSGRRLIEVQRNMMVDFTDLAQPLLVIPFKGLLRRTCNKGVWLSGSYSEQAISLHLRINRIQIDDQRDACLFNVIMAPVAPPKSLATERAPKAFVELSLVVYTQASSRRIKYLTLLVQEFLLQVELGFINELYGFASDALGWNDSNAATCPTELAKWIEDDVKYCQELGMFDRLKAEGLGSSRHFYDCIHFSPLKVHMSFSLGSATGDRWPLGLDFIVKSAGVTLTEFRDVLFKLDCFERRNLFMADRELIGFATSHYTNQVLKQFYMIVLGLDVIGNPVGLVMGLKQGVGDFFYEPFMGIVEGPEEFAEGLALGAKSLFSHTVGGAAGALGRITGTIGTGLSHLTFDDEIQRRRRERIRRGGGGVVEGSKNLAQSFVGGITGLFTKPVAGARDDGFEGFIKGVGKGAVGLVAQPATGVVDFASGGLNAIKRAVDPSRDAIQVRPRRVFAPDGRLTPYNRHESEGAKVLDDLSRGQFRSTDHYIVHGPVSKGMSMIVTDRRLIMYDRGTMCTSGWQVTWQCPYSAMRGINLVFPPDPAAQRTGHVGQGIGHVAGGYFNPTQMQTKLVIELRDAGNGGGGDRSRGRGHGLVPSVSYAATDANSKIISFDSERIAKILYDKIQKAFHAAK